MFLARKISRSKWKSQRELAEGEVQAQAIAADLRTDDDALSVWSCGAEEATREDAKEPALALASVMDRASTIDLVWIDKDALDQAGLQVLQTDEITNVPDLRSHHYDIRTLDCTRLRDIATQIAAAIEEDQYCRFSRSEVLDLLADAVESERLEIKTLKCRLHQQVHNTLDKRRNSPTYG